MSMLKSFIQQLTPPVVYSALRRFLDLTRVGTPVYEGIYSEAHLLPSCPNDPFSHPNWLAYVNERGRQRAMGVADQNMHEICMSLLASVITQTSDAGKPTVIDFGGGVGMSWTALKAQDRTDSINRFIVVDNERNCRLGREIFPDEKVSFCTTLQEAVAASSGVSVLNVASTLQYCLDYVAVLNELRAVKAAFIVISRHPSPGNGVPVAYTVQNISTNHGFCGQIPVVLVNVETIEKIMIDGGYRLIANYFGADDSGKYWRFSKAPVPPHYRRITEHALVFQRVTG
jgi:putative methyltransferase (TIGR04325 family)